MTGDRTKASFINMIVSFGGQFLSVFLTFAGRLIFIRYFTAEYLGVNGLFSNILNVLSLAELGIGNAMIYSLYKPVAGQDEDKIRRLMNLYCRMYRMVALVVFVLGFSLLPFLKYLIKGNPGIPHLHLIYLMYLANTACTYLLGYKQSIIMAHQKEYINKLYLNFFRILQVLLQIAALVLTKNYYLYLALQLVCSVASNWMLARRADRMYPYLRKDRRSLPEQIETRSIFKNISALIIHRVGSKLTHNTDTLIISAFIGLVKVGVYSNYSLVMTTMNTLLSNIYQAFTASVGNLVVTETEEDSYRIYRTLNFSLFLIFGYCTIGLAVLLNPFVALVFGRDYLLETGVTVLLCMDFYITGMRQITLRFRDAYGVFWNDRYKPIAASLLNLVLSLSLVTKYGIGGVLTGTVISNFAINLWVEPFVLMKHGFRVQWRRKLRSYVIDFAGNTAFVAVLGIALYLLCQRIPVGGLAGFLLKGAIITILYGGSAYLCFFEKEEMLEIRRRIKNIITKKEKMDEQEGAN